MSSSSSINLSYNFISTLPVYTMDNDRHCVVYKGEVEGGVAEMHMWPTLIKS